jgi:hypothetical protein
MTGTSMTIQSDCVMIHVMVCARLTCNTQCRYQQARDRNTSGSMSVCCYPGMYSIGGHRCLTLEPRKLHNQFPCTPQINSQHLASLAPVFCEPHLER